MANSILVLEDNADLRMMYRMYFKGQGFTVRAAGTGEEALKLLAQEKASIILLDLGLPSMSGGEFLQQLRAVGGHEDTKILVTSGRDNLKQVATELGADGYALKPADLDKLHQQVNSLLQS